MRKSTRIAPSHWANFLINGDSTGLSNEDKDQAIKFSRWLGGAIVYCSSFGFVKHHDATQFGALAAECEEYTALVPNKMLLRIIPRTAHYPPPESAGPDTTDRERVRELPNFDAEIFFKITGIDLR